MGPSIAVPEAGHRARCRIVVEGVVQGSAFVHSSIDLPEPIGSAVQCATGNMVS